LDLAEPADSICKACGKQMKRVCCVYDINDTRSKTTAARENCESSASAQEAVGRDDLDAVIVATPTKQHFECVQMCLDAGKPVLVEKPLGSNLRQIDDCFGMAKERSIPLFVAFQRRFDPAFSSLVNSVRQKKKPDSCSLFAPSRETALLLQQITFDILVGFFTTVWSTTWTWFVTLSVPFRLT
jgi:myo-inositol 2-dehydrogenase / D-chiro-inositol 1-dehydrogenase